MNYNNLFIKMMLRNDIKDAHGSILIYFSIGPRKDNVISNSHIGVRYIVDTDGRKVEFIFSPQQDSKSFQTVSVQRDRGDRIKIGNIALARVLKENNNVLQGHIHEGNGKFWVNIDECIEYTHQYVQQSLFN